MRSFGRKLILVGLVISFIPVITGCSLLGGPKKKPEVSLEEVKSMVKQEIKSPETEKNHQRSGG